MSEQEKQENTHGHTIIQTIEDEMKKSYLDYAMSVIVGRALPDVRDGLKPVHRRILFAMSEMGNTFNKPYKKCARIVGEVLGKYHPHGDTAVYDSLVRMAQDFSLRYPLIQGQGNFGSIDGDSPAAMRYTEARLSKISDEILRDIDKETVDFGENFDGTLKEPLVLPSKFPNLLVNGSAGIAVGMATNIPPHNLSESCQAVIQLIDDPNISDDTIFSIVKGPDFPTAAEIVGRAGILNAYKTGKGIVKIRSIMHIEEKKDRKRLIVTEIPYQVNKSQLIQDIAQSIRDKKLPDISDIRDESDRDGIRIVFELKRDANPEIVKNLLYAHSRLQDTFGINFVALVNNEPRLLPLKKYFEYYLEHRVIVVRRRCQYDLRKAEERAHILSGLKIALDHIDDVVALIKASKSADEAKHGLMETYDLTEVQSQAILEMRLQRLALLEQEKITNEYNALLQTITELQAILASEARILALIRAELQEIITTYGSKEKRKTAIIDAEDDDLDIENLIANEPVVVTMSSQGYVKRIPVETYKSQNRGGRGIMASDVKENDYMERAFVAKTHDFLLIFTSKGKLHWLKTYKIPDAARQSLGKALVNLLELDADEKVNAVIPIKEFDEKHYVFMATRDGTVKKTKLSEFSNPRKGGIIAISLDDESKNVLVNAVLTDGTKNIMMATRDGVAAKFNEEDVRSVGRGAAGVRGIRLEVGDAVIGMIIAEENKKILTLTENGYGKMTEVAEYRLINRGGKGVININCSDRNGKVAAICSATDDDEVLLISKKGILIRTSCTQIATSGRNTQGVRLMKLATSDKATSIAKVMKE